MGESNKQRVWHIRSTYQLFVHKVTVVVERPSTTHLSTACFINNIASTLGNSGSTCNYTARNGQTETTNALLSYDRSIWNMHNAPGLSPMHDANPFHPLVIRAMPSLSMDSRALPTMLQSALVIVNCKSSFPRNKRVYCWRTLFTEFIIKVPPIF